MNDDAQSADPQSNAPDPVAKLRERVTKAVEKGRKLRVRAKQEEARAKANGGSYEDSIVTFIDILGFRSLIASRVASEIHEIILKLRTFGTPEREPPIRRMKDARLISRAFSDSVSDAVVRVRVFATQHRDGAFFHEILDLLHIQVQCVGSGVLIRAGLAIGDAHVGIDGKGPIFGPAMVRAVDIETKEAVFPRIMIDEAAYQAFLTDTRLHKDDHSFAEEVAYVDRLLRIDADGTRYVDYLVASESEFDDFADYLSFLERHADLVRENLNTTREERVLSKYIWLAQYHNDVVEALAARCPPNSEGASSFFSMFEVEPSTYFATLRVSL